MGQRTEQIVRRMTEEGQKSLTFFRSLKPDDWLAQVYTEGTRWTVRQVLCHFVSAERAFERYGRDIVNGGEGAPEDFVIDEFNEREVAAMANTSNLELLAQFEQARRATIDLVISMTDEDLQREGRHPWFGWNKIDKFLKLVYRHNMIHQRDIRRALEGGQPADV
jgi:uncharacterized protein (TIGR03083 family)